MYRNITLLFLISSKLIWGAEQAQLSKDGAMQLFQVCRININNFYGKSERHRSGYFEHPNYGCLEVEFKQIGNILRNLAELINIQNKQIDKLQEEVKQLKDAKQPGAE